MHHILAFFLTLTTVQALKLSHTLVKRKFRFSFLLSEGRDDLEVKKNEEAQVKVGSKDYYKGFVESSLNEETDPRGDGLKQTLALAGNATIVLALLTALFLKSNGII